MNVKQLRELASVAWTVISKSDTQAHEIKLENGWTLRAERVYRRGCPGPAWSPRYYLVSPTQKSFGGYDSAKSFASHFGNPYVWQWIDDYRANGFKKETL